MDTRPQRRPPDPPRDKGASAETAAEARQGPLGRPVLYVLAGGLVLAAIFLIATQLWNASEDLPPAGAIEPAVTVQPATPL